jgi:molecular chaperone GrpE
LRTQLQEKEAEAKANYDLFLRERADLENFKRRMQRDKSEALRFANEPVIRDLLPILDNLERAVTHAQVGGNSQSLIEGVSLVLRSFLEMLEKHGVNRVSAKGQPFDPHKHEAMAQVESTEVEPNTVVDEYTPAYLLHDRLLRPASVTVAKPPADEKKSDT